MGKYLITGANRGLGLEFTKQLLASGHKVIACTRSFDDAEELKSLESDKCILKKLDVTSNEEIANLVNDISDEVVDVLINNAGIYNIGSNNFSELKVEDLISVMQVNTFAPLKLTKALLPILKKSPSPKVIHITSKMGSMTDNTSGGSYSYRLSKAALNAWNKSFSIDHPGIMTLVLHPGWVRTRMGGPNGLIDAKESVSGMLKVINETPLEKSGGFYDYAGNEVPW